MAANKRDEKIFPLQLSLQRKAQLVAILYAMFDSVATVKFSELDFTEEQNSSSNKVSKVTTSFDEEKTEPKKCGIEFEAQKRKRNLNNTA